MFELSFNLRICKIFVLEIDRKGWKEMNLYLWVERDKYWV